MSDNFANHEPVKPDQRTSRSVGANRSAPPDGIQVDVYGVKFRLGTSPDDTAEPTSWIEVAERINTELKSIVSNTVSLAADVLRAARSLVRGIGGLPTRLAARVGRAHARADSAEAERSASVSSGGEAVARLARERIEALLLEKRESGLTAEVYLDPQTNHLVVCVLPAMDGSQVADLAASALLTAAPHAARPSYSEAQMAAPQSTAGTRARKILESLPDTDAAILRALFLEEDSKDDVARRFGVDANYISKLLKRVRRKFH